MNDEPQQPHLRSFTTPDTARMAEFTVALNVLAQEHGFLLEANPQVVATERSFPRLRLTFMQADQPTPQRERAEAAQAIRALFDRES